MNIEKLPTRYFAGSASVQAGSTIVTPHDAAWAGNIWGDDLFFLPSQPLVPPVRIETVNADNTLTLAYGWPGAAATEDPYEIRYVGIIERSTAQSRRVLEQLGDVKTWADVFVQTDVDRLALETPSNPLRSGLRVLVADDGVIWAKASGAYGDWIGPAEFTGPQGNPGPFTSITFGPVTTLPAGEEASANAVVIGPGQIRIDLSIPEGRDGTGTGDFVGPNSATPGNLVAYADNTGKLGGDGGILNTGTDDNRALRSNGTGGKSAQPSLVVISDDGGMTLAAPMLLDDAISIAAPVLSFDGDTNTGVAHPAADTLALVVGGADKLRLASSGALSAPIAGGTTHYPFFGARAFANFNGTNQSIRASGNVTSITRTSTGRYAMNFATPMPDSNYTPIVTAIDGSSAVFGNVSTGDVSLGTSALQITTANNTQTAFADANQVFVAVFR